MREGREKYNKKLKYKAKKALVIVYVYTVIHSLIQVSFE